MHYIYNARLGPSLKETLLNVFRSFCNPRCIAGVRLIRGSMFLNVKYSVFPVTLTQMVLPPVCDEAVQETDAMTGSSPSRRTCSPCATPPVYQRLSAWGMKLLSQISSLILALSHWKHPFNEESHIWKILILQVETLSLMSRLQNNVKLTTSS